MLTYIAFSALTLLDCWLSTLACITFTLKLPWDIIMAVCVIETDSSYPKHVRV